MDIDHIKGALRRHGWRPIASDAQAAQLLRRAVKFHRGQTQRNPEHRCDFDYLLAVKRGNWFKFVEWRRSGESYRSILIRRMPKDS